MTYKERAAIIRILRDLIKADTVIDQKEIGMYYRLKGVYRIGRDEEIAAASLTLAEALDVVKKSDKAERTELMKRCVEMVVSDGFCTPAEALLVTSLMYCLNVEDGIDAQVYSVHAPEIAIEDHQVVYVESAYDTQINEDIQQNYRAIDKELRLAGFDFAYIPYVTAHYRNTDIALFKEVTKFLAPTIAEDKVEDLIHHLMGVTTAEYCTDQLVNRLGISELRNVMPSLLIKVGDTYVGDKPYINFLRLSVDDDVLPLVQNFVDRYMSLLSSDVHFVKRPVEGSGQFMYYGFYKQLFDIYVIQKGVRSNLLLDIVGERVILSGLAMEVKGLHRRDKALYALLLIESERGGLDFSPPTSARQIAAYERRMAEIQERYTHLYLAFNGDRNAVPSLSVPEIRRPIVSNIRRRIKAMADVLHNVEDYNVLTDSYGRLCVGLSQDLVTVREYAEDGGVVEVPLADSKTFKF